MKRNSTILICLLILSITAFGQSAGDPNGISTNPANPVNPIDPGFINRFDWTNTSGYPFNATCYPNGYTYNPFNTSYANLVLLLATKDYLPSDGWEVIHYNLGYDRLNNPLQQRPEHTYLILYNKYTGLLRILLKTCRGQDYQGLRLKIHFNEDRTKYQSNLFDYAGDLKALTTPHRPNEGFTTTRNFINDYQQWYYADFQMNYDPCTCAIDNPSYIRIISELLSEAEIKLEGAITGTITTVKDNKTNSDGNFWSNAKNINEKMMKVHGGISDFTKNYEAIYKNLSNAGVKIDAIKQLGEAMKSNSFLKGGLAAVPYVGQALSFISGLVGGGRTGTGGPVELMPLSLNASVNLKGTITSASQYHSINFALPGGKQARNDEATYPFYNEVLGVFALIDEPTIYYEDLIEEKNYEFKPSFGHKIYNSYTARYSTYYQEATYQFNRRNYKFNGQPIRYAINPASGLELQDAQVVLMIEYEKQGPKYLGYKGAGFCYSTDTIKGVWLPEYIVYQSNSERGLRNPVNGLFQNATQPISLEHFNTNFYFPSALYNIKLKNTDAYTIKQDIYRRETKQSAGEYFRLFQDPSNVPAEYTRCCSEPIPDNPVTACLDSGKPLDEFLEPWVKGFYLKFILNLRRKDGQGQNVLYVATFPVKLAPKPAGFSFQYTIWDLFNIQHRNSNIYNHIRPATPDELRSICGSSLYTNGRILQRTKALAEEANNKPPFILNEGNDITLMPNPAQSIMQVKVPGDNIKLVAVYNAAGALVYQFGKETITKESTMSLDVSGWSSGVYFLKYTNNGKTTSKQFVVGN